MDYRRNIPLEIFLEVYRAYPASFLGREDLEMTNSIILPPSALDKLSTFKKGFGSESSPVLFRILNIDLNISTHCGVLDFTAEEDTCYIPLHMFNRLILEPGMMVNIRNINLEKGKFVKIRTHQTELIMNSNPRAILENSLRNYVCITKGDTITVKFNKTTYLMDIIECKPKDAIRLTNVDVEVDFDKPLDYKEEVVENKTNIPNSLHNKETNKIELSETEIKQKIQDDKFKGNCSRVDGKEITINQLQNFEKEKKIKSGEDTYDPRKNRLGIKGNKNNAFKGNEVNSTMMKKVN